MKKVREQGLKKNLIYNIVYQVVVVLSPLVVTPKFSRIMGPDYVGLRSFTFSIVFYFAVIGALGLDMYGQRRIAIVKDDKAERSKVFWSIYMVKAASCFISLCVYACAFVLFNSDATMRILYLCWTLYLVREMLNPVWYLQGVERFRLVSLVNIFSQIAYVACVFLFVNQKSDLWLYIVFYAAIPLFVALLFLIPVLTDVQRVRLNKKELATTIKESFVYFVPTIASSLYSMIDKTMLGFFDKSQVTTGYYEQAEKLVKVALAFVTASFTIIRTRMSYVCKNKTEEEYRAYSKIFITFSMFICWPIVFGIIGIARDFVPLFFGDGYDSVVGLAYVFVSIIPCLTISGLLQAIYTFPQGLQNKVNVYYVIVLGVNCVLNMCLIPFFQSHGAVVASICSELLLAVILLIKSRKSIEIKLFLTTSIRYIIAAAVMLVPMYFVSITSLGLLARVCIEFICGCATYFVACILLRDKFFIEQLKRVFSVLTRGKRKAAAPSPVTEAAAEAEIQAEVKAELQANEQGEEPLNKGSGDEI